MRKCTAFVPKHLLCEVDRNHLECLVISTLFAKYTFASDISEKLVIPGCHTNVLSVSNTVFNGYIRSYILP